MKKSIRILALIMTLVTLSAFAACGSEGNKVPEEKPQYTAEEIEAFFTYSSETFEGREYLYISGVTDEAKKLTALIVPVSHDGKQVYGLQTGCFAGCADLKTIYVGSNIVEWQGNLFSGCKSLKKIYMDYADFVDEAAKDPAKGDAFTCAKSSDGSVYGKGSILEGLSGTKFVFTDAAVFDFFDVNYSWAAYSSAFVKE
ncbi:MAG: hypothetical protein MJ137_08885 [Clostridia bacterium]|nr:hypothetical protein [Clostridia bacterium]